MRRDNPFVDFAACPGCYSDLHADLDAEYHPFRGQSGRGMWVCRNPDCSEVGGGWVMTENAIRACQESEVEA